MKITRLSILLCLAICYSSVGAEPLKPSLVDYPGFLKLSNDVSAYRTERLIDLDTFLQMADEAHTIILDTRSKVAYENKHIKGAIHLNFSDFTKETLAAVIPSKETRILIYCNNNIASDPRNFGTKRVTVALNIPTFINLYEYGYRNVYELSQLVPTDDPRLVFEGALK